MSSAETDPKSDRTLTVTLGHEQVVIHHRYEVASILNDLMLGLWFTVGSVFFFYPSLKEAGVWLFVVGSVQLMVRPLIRISRLVHLRNISRGGWDY
jgi:hypothetical protein